MKLCECGCGELTSLSRYNDASKGRIKGQPLRFIRGHNKGALFKGTIQKRFESFFEKTPNACWIWKGSKNNKGYGWFNRHTLAHRFSYELYKGSIPKGLNVLHKCDNPPCVNPDHLSLGTVKDNKQDEVNKKRHQYGEKHCRAKLTEQDILNVRNDNRTHKEIAKNYGISKALIGAIKRKEIWKHI